MEEEKGHIDIDSLIAKELSGEISVSEKFALDRWIALSDENKTYVAEMHEVWSFVPNDPIWQPATEDTELAWKKVKAKTKTSKEPRIIKLPRMLAFAASFALVISVAWWFSRESTTDINYILAQTEATSETISLADGSVVELMPYSSLSYPEAFEGTIRNVSLEGAAEFIVESDKAHPFIIESGQSVIEVLGTQFFVSQASDSVFVEVTEGIVELYAIEEMDKAKKQSVKIHKNESAFKAKAEPIVVKKALDYHLHDLFFEATAVSEVLTELESLYGVSIEIENEEFLSCTYSAKLSQVNLYDVLEMLSLIFDIEVIQTESQILISGQGC